MVNKAVAALQCFLWHRPQNKIHLSAVVIVKHRGNTNALADWIPNARINVWWTEMLSWETIVSLIDLKSVNTFPFSFCLKLNSLLNRLTKMIVLSICSLRVNMRTAVSVVNNLIILDHISRWRIIWVLNHLVTYLMNGRKKMSRRDYVINGCFQAQGWFYNYTVEQTLTK